ncbi:MAG: ACP S-malonyltransferase [Deltaproteobacteria bacterium]|nr:ACP S-malonyltransferase [Deltaproteobacteria bacterium]
MTLAFLFGGQGTEVPRMGLDLAAHVPPAAALLDLAGAVAGVDARSVLAEAGPELRRTSVIQPLLVAVGLGACAALATEGIAPRFVAGHSLGELTAWAAAGAIGDRAAVELAGLRGRLMEREAARNPGGMHAITGDDSEVAELVARHGVALAAHNGPEEWTVSGDTSRLAALASSRATTRLPVAGAWHSPAMAGAVDELARAIRSTALAKPRANVIANSDGRAVADPDAVAELLAGQLVRPVQWASCLRTLAAAGVTTYVVLGPSKLLRSTVHKNLGRDVRVIVVETFRDVAAAREQLRA